MIEVLTPGIWSSVQDLGRFGYRYLGVPTSGAMDRNSAQKANLLLHNHPNDALIETLLGGLKLKFHVPTSFVVCGAHSVLQLNGNFIKNQKIYPVTIGDVLSIGQLLCGTLTYVAVKGGVLTPEILGSRSFFKAITPMERLTKNTFLNIHRFDDLNYNEKPFASLKALKIISETIDVFKGPEFELLPETIKTNLESKSFSVSQKFNRMAYLLTEKFPNRLPSILTGPVLPGTVQLTPSGQFIVLMRDSQTTGGYPRILQLTDESINFISQKRTREVFNFRLIEHQKFD